MADCVLSRYSWHNSDVGNAVPVFKQGMEHFVRLHYDKKTSELVVSEPRVTRSYHCVVCAETPNVRRASGNL